jgi:hypothetical protein
LILLLFIGVINGLSPCPLILSKSTLLPDEPFFALAGRAIGKVHKTRVYTEDTDHNFLMNIKGNDLIPTSSVLTIFIIGEPHT